MKTNDSRPLQRSKETFSDYLIRKGLLSTAQVEIVCHEQEITQSKYLNLQEDTPIYGINNLTIVEPLSFERTLLSLNFFQEDQLVQYLSDYSRYPIINLETYTYDPNLLSYTFIPFLKKYFIFPLKKRSQITSKDSITTLDVAVVDPYDVKALDHIRSLYQVDQLTIYLCKERQLIHFFDDLLIKNITFLDLFKKIPLDIFDLKNTNENPVEDLIYFVLTQALHYQATDVHFQPHINWIQLSYRIKGMLQPITVFHKKYWGVINTRLKIMAFLDIANQRFPQSGQFVFLKGSKEIACRLSTHPLATVNAGQKESIVIRFLNTNNGFFSLEKLGFNNKNQEKLKRITQGRRGLTIIAGPTGSGKTTTAYALLKTLKKQYFKVMTLEEPVEFFFPFLHQTEIRRNDDLTFEEALKSILRQDPDLLFIGEIRDRKAAALALQTSLIGHPVFTTLHATDALSVVPRLINLDLDPQILAHSLQTIVAQRLMRHLCCYCKKPIMAENIETFYTNLLPFLYTSTGCEKCSFTGYQGYFPLIEILEINDDFCRLISNDMYNQNYKKWAQSVGFIPLAQLAFENLLKGNICLLDTIQEINLKQWMQDHPEHVHISLR